MVGHVIASIPASIDGMDVFLHYRVYTRVERLEQKITTLIQEVALRDVLKPGTKPGS